MISVICIVYQDTKHVKLYMYLAANNFKGFISICTCTCTCKSHSTFINYAVILKFINSQVW